MEIDLIGAAASVLILAVVVLAGVAPFVLIIGFFRVGARRFSGRRGRHDALFEGIGRANAVNSHLQAGTLHPDDAAVPTPVVGPPGPRRRRRSRRA